MATSCRHGFTLRQDSRILPFGSQSFEPWGAGAMPATRKVTDSLLLF